MYNHNQITINNQHGKQDKKKTKQGERKREREREREKQSWIKWIKDQSLNNCQSARKSRTPNLTLN